MHESNYDTSRRQTVIFPALSLQSRNTNLAEKLAPYFARCCALLNKLYHFHPKIIEGFRNIQHFSKTERSLQTGLLDLL